MTARPLLAALAALAAVAALTAPVAAAPCNGITDVAGDTGVFVVGYERAPTPAPSLDIVKGTVTVATKTTTFRVHVDDLETRAADTASGADWQWELKTKTGSVHVVARVQQDGGETFVRRDVPLHTGQAPTVDATKDTITWTVPTAVLTKAGLTRTTNVAPTISTWRGTAAPDTDDAETRVHADFADGRSAAWGRVGC